MSGAGEVGLLDFLLARFAEDRAAAWACAAVYPPPWELSDRGWVAYVKADAPAFREVARLEQGTASGSESRWLGEALEHVARWDPARVLAECEAKERIVAAHDLWMHASGDWTCDAGETWTPSSFIDGEPDRSGGCLTLRLLALPYAEHPDFRAEWRS